MLLSGESVLQRMFPPLAVALYSVTMALEMLVFVNFTVTR